ncbi:MAG: hypothetical protein RR325_01655 [Bacilli bacterium]
MILRKPYALLIKNFRLMHIIFALLSIFLFSKCSNFLSFLNDYIVNNGFILETFRIKELLPFYIFLAIILMLILNITVVVLLKLKDKSIIFYIVNIIIYIALFILLYYFQTVLHSMQIRLIDTRIIRALRDMFVFINGVQIISILMYIVRATGFDVKKFNFGKDLIALDIVETDNEEFEIAVNVDVDKINRNRRKSFRMLRYFYVENKFMCNCGLAFLALVISIISIVGIINKEKAYHQFEKFKTNDYSLEIDNVYMTDKDKNEKIIEKDKSFVVLEVKIKKNSSKKMKLNIGRFELKIKGVRYYHQYVDPTYFSDIGKVYFDEELNTTTDKYLLVYKINSGLTSAKKTFKYIDSYGDAFVKINVMDISKDEMVSTHQLNNEISFDKSILNKYKINIENYDIKDKFIIDYKYCVSKGNCTGAKEYIVPSISSNYNKTLLKIKGVLNIPEEKSGNVNSLNSLLTNYGIINYTIEDKVYSDKLDLGFLVPSKVKQENIYYIEVKEELKSAKKIELILKLRNKTYKYILRGE